MSTERFGEFRRELLPFAGLWQSAEFAVIAVGDKSGDLVSLATSVVLKPDRVESVRVVRDVRPPGLSTPFLAASVEYPLAKALNEWEPLRTLVEVGRFTLEIGSNLPSVRLFGAPIGPAADQSGSSWTKALHQTRTESKTRFGIDRRCIALLNTCDASNALCRLVTDDLLKEIDSKLRARPYLIDGLGGLMSELMPGMRLSMDACPPTRVVAPLPFDLEFQPERRLIVNAPEAAFARGMEVSVFFRPTGEPYSFQLGVANSVQIGRSDMREWRQDVGWRRGAQSARAVLLYQTQQIEEVSFGRLSSPIVLIADAVEDWQAITPADLVPAIEHIRTTFDESVWKCSEVTKKLCFAALHPDDKDIDLQPYEAALVSYRTIIGPRAAQQFDNDRGPGTPPAIFHAFLQALAAGIRTEVGRLFNDVLQIGTAHMEGLKQHPADWAKSHLAMLINGNKHTVGLWIQSVCDKQDYTRPARTEQEFEDLIHWRDWRAPKLIYMRPSGNLPYDPATAWTREDEQVTEKLLESLSARIVQSLGFELDTLAGRAHVELAKASRNAGSTLEGDDRRFGQMAIEEALKSVPEDDRPHPKVGAVVVKDGRVLSKAHRGESPKSHAEYIALDQKLSDDLVAGATVYTTLEPCTTRKHPKIPCAQRLVDRKVARVVIGMLDPNPDIRGLGDQLLSDAGIETQLFPRELRAQVEEMNREWIRMQKQKAPRLTTNVSLDSAATVAARALIDATRELQKAVWSFYDLHTRYRVDPSFVVSADEERQILEKIDSALKVFYQDYDFPISLSEVVKDEIGRINIALLKLKEFAISVQEPEFKIAATQIQDASEKIHTAAKPYAYRRSV
jgi:pyrimidine deaminase RibD-like protein